MDIDIFAPIPCPEPYSLDLVSISSRFSMHTIVPSGSTSANSTGHTSASATGSQKSSPRLNTFSSTSNKSTNANTRFNCTLCKKSFGTEATWNSHQMSAKHQAAVKDAEKKTKSSNRKAVAGLPRVPEPNGGSGRSEDASVSNVAGQLNSPELTEALQSLQKAENAAKTHPSLVAPVLWKTAKVLWANKLYKETKDALTLLISILEGLQKSSALGAAQQQGNLTPTQINLTLYLARLAAARLVVYETPSVACQFYVDAIQGRWQMPASTFQLHSEAIGVVAVDQLLQQVFEFLEHHDKTQKLVRPSEPIPESSSASGALATASTAPPKKQPDPNLKLLTVVTEMGSLLAQLSSSQSRGITKGSRQREGSGDLTPQEQSQAEFALIALAMASTIAKFDAEQGVNLEPTLARRRAAIYERLGMPYYAGQCYGETSSMAGCTPNDREWDEFRALLLAVEADDPIRVAQSLQRAASLEPYLDAQVLMMIAKAIASADYDVLENDVRIHVDHLKVLVQSGATSQLLMAKHCPETEYLLMISRIQGLVPL